MLLTNIILYIDPFNDNESLLRDSFSLLANPKTTFHFIHILPTVTISFPYVLNKIYIGDEVANKPKDKVDIQEIKKNYPDINIHVHSLRGDPRIKLTLLAKKIAADLIIINNTATKDNQVFINKLANSIKIPLLLIPYKEKINTFRLEGKILFINFISNNNTKIAFITQELLKIYPLDLRVLNLLASNDISADLLTMSDNAFPAKLHQDNATTYTDFNFTQIGEFIRSINPNLILCAKPKDNYYWFNQHKVFLKKLIIQADNAIWIA